MKLWHITRTDETDYDETNSLVIRAETEAEARAMAFAQDPDWPVVDPEQDDPMLLYPGLREDNLVITELTAEGEPGVIVHDFMRG
jgi:hypothetical protein